MDRHISLSRPVTFDGEGGIIFAYQVGQSIRDLLHKSQGGRGVILMLVDTLVILEGVESSDVECTFLPGDDIFDDCPFDEEEQAAIRSCMDACGPDEYVLIAVVCQRYLAQERVKETVHVCVASRNLEEGAIKMPDPRNN